MQCADCGATLPTAAKFCLECGAPIESSPAPASYTPRHLTEQILAMRGALEGERKQVTVLFCDIVHSSELARELGPEGYHELVDRFFAVALEEVHRYEGTVNQFLGDGFMALFGAPLAHEDHARRALLAGLAIRERAPVAVRIGLNSGAVVVGAIGDDLRMDYTAFGDTTILAARLQAAAQAGEVLVSPETAGLVPGYFEFEPAAPVEVKERTVHPVRVTGLGPRTSPLDETASHLSPFRGRERELGALQAALAAVVEGEGGQVFGLVGEPGLGKSRLILEFRRHAIERATVLEGRCLAYGSTVPYGPVLDLVRNMCGIAVRDGADLIEQKLQMTLAALDLEADHGLYLLHLLGLAAERLAAVDARAIKGRTLEALRSLLLAEAARRPVVVVIEDVHWIDRTSEDVLNELVSEVGSTPILLVTTARPGYKSPWIDRSFATQVALRPLPGTACAEIVSSLLGDGGSAETAGIVERGEGNPFFLEELARAARQQLDTSVPQTVQEVLAARIDRLGPTQKATIQLAAVLGREFPLNVIDEVSTADASLLPELEELKRLEFLRERRGPDERTFVFSHALTREVAYDTLLEARRRELHGRAGTVIERLYADRLYEKYELLAYHYARSSDEARAADYLESANEKARAQQAADEAVAYFYETLAVLERLPDSEATRRRRVVLVLAQLNVFHYLWRLDEYLDVCTSHEQIALELGVPKLLGRLQTVLAFHDVRRGEYVAGLKRAGRALPLCVQAGDPEGISAAYNGQLWCYAFLGDHTRALECHERACEQLPLGFNPEWHMYIYGGAVCSLVMTGRWDAALQKVDEAVADGVERSDRATVCFVSMLGSWAMLEQRDWARALEYAGAALAAAPSDPFRAYMAAFVASALCHSGSTDQLPVIEEVAAVAKSINHEIGWAIIAWRLAHAYLVVGDRTRAKDVLTELLHASERSQVPFYGGGARRCLAELALAESDAAEALRQVEPAIDLLRLSGCENELALALAVRGRAQRMLGDEDAAHENLREAITMLDRLGTLEEPNRLRRLSEALRAV